MAPFLVLVDSYVELCFKEEDGAAEKNKGAVAAAPTFQSLMDSTISLQGSLAPEALLHQPPKISTLRLRSSRSVRDAGRLRLEAVVTCDDKSMLILYGGQYSGPGSSMRGCYLIYDTAVSGSSALKTVPSLPHSPYLTGVGEGAVVLRSDYPASSYILAELATTPERRLPDADLYLWRSDSPTPQWEKKAVQLPPEVRSAPGKHNFCADTSFSFGASSLCWVDLLRGILVCHHGQGQDPQFRFIPLPDGCPEYGTSSYTYRPNMPEFSARPPASPAPSSSLPWRANWKGSTPRSSGLSPGP